MAPSIFEDAIPIPTYDILRAAEPPALDGWLESPAWRSARWVEQFLAVETGRAAAKPTAAALLWDDQCLYVGVRCAEPRPGHLRAEAADAKAVWLDDTVELYLNAGIPGVESLDTAINALGRLCPAQRVLDDPGWGTYRYQSPDGIRAAARLTGTGWQLELAWPFGVQGLPRPEPGATWRGNVCRNDRLGFTWSFWALGQPPGYTTYSDGQLFPYLRFSPDAAAAPAAAAPAPTAPRWPKRPRFELRGMMYDTSRGSMVYTPAYWAAKLPFLRDLGYNALMMYFENHLRYAAHGEFAPEGAWTLRDLAALQEAAGSHGIDVIPAQTSLGHCPGILTHPRYQHLAEEGSNGYQFCAAHPETRAVLGAIFGELAQASRSDYVNVNCDESAYLGLCPRCRETYRGWSKGRILRDHLLFLHGVLRSHGKRMMMWDDMLWTFPDALEGLPRDIILLDWHYTFHRRYPSVDVWRKAGFDVVVCPGMYMVENAFWIADYGAARGAMGLLNTLWEDHSLPLGSRWQHLLATAWAARAKAPTDLERWWADAGRYLFGPAGERLGRSLAAQDRVRRNGQRVGGPAAPLERAAQRQVREEAERLLERSGAGGESRSLLEEFLYAARLQELQQDAAVPGVDPAAIRSRAARLREEGLARWARQCAVPSQQPAFLERFTALEAALGG
jgi:hypothetical protein